MVRIEGRSPKASGQMITAGCAPVAGVMNAASHVPSGVLISTFVSVTCCCAARSVPAAAIMPAATVVTKSRRVSSSFSMVRVLHRGEYYLSMSVPRFLHVTNGTSLTMSMEAARMPGLRSIWADPLYEGPVPAGLSDEELVDVRTRYLLGAHTPDEDRGNALRRGGEA